MITIFIKDCNITEIIQPKNYFLIAYLLLNKEIQNCQILPSGFATCFVSLYYCLYCSFSGVSATSESGPLGIACSDATTTLLGLLYGYW